MLFQILLYLLGLIILIGVLLRLFNCEWFSAYGAILIWIIAVPISLIIVVAYLVYTILLKPLFLLLKGIAKAGIYLAVWLVITAVFVLTYLIPYLGQLIQNLSTLPTRLFRFTTLRDDCAYTRRIMIEIVAEHSNRDLEYEDKTPYREELVAVRERAKRRLAAGESALSLFIGSVLLLLQLTHTQIFQYEYIGIPVSLVIQVVLFVISISIIYRVSILDFLAFTGEEDFNDLHEMDVALSYQQALSNGGFSDDQEGEFWQSVTIDFLQSLVFMVIFGMSLMSTDRKIVSDTLRLFYGDRSFFEAMKFAWRQLRGENQSN